MTIVKSILQASQQTAHIPRLHDTDPDILHIPDICQVHLARRSPCCITDKHYRVIIRNAIEDGCPDTIRSLDTADYKGIHTKGPEHQVEFRTDERAHPGLGEYILSSLWCEFIDDRSSMSAGNGKWLLFEKILPYDLYVRTIWPVHPQDMKDRKVSLPEFGQHRLDFWYYS